MNQKRVTDIRLKTFLRIHNNIFQTELKSITAELRSARKVLSLMEDEGAPYGLEGELRAVFIAHLAQFPED